MRADTFVPDVTIALTGQGTVVSAPTTGVIENQMPLIEASMPAGVKRSLPFEFSSDIDNPKVLSCAVYQPQIHVHRVLQE